MIIPSIDLQNGSTVQLIGGREKALDAGDPIPIAERFRLAGEIAVIDLDAAVGTGSNTDLIREIVRIAPCRVGGGIRDAATALDWLDAGACKVIIGTAAVPEVLEQLPSERVIAALDAVDGQVVIEGWRKETDRSIEERMLELKGMVGGFLVTFVEREGRQVGIDPERVKELARIARPARLTVAGGVRSADEIGVIDRLGADAQVGMALYSGGFSLGDAIAATITSDREDGLWPTVVVDEIGTILGLVWSDRESLEEAIRRRRGIYHSRSRGLWIKGETSGATQELLAVDLDCDRDALRFTVRQNGSGFCHSGTRTCWGEDRGFAHLFRRLSGRLRSAPAGSYTARLLADADLLAAKLTEEAGELAEATTRPEVIHESADLLYFTLVTMIRNGVDLEEVAAELDRRSLRVRRRDEQVQS
ncbi:phosphoribosyl-ATP diphosphatase [Gemmatimonadota bacterium]